LIDKTVVQRTTLLVQRFPKNVRIPRCLGCSRFK